MKKYIAAFDGLRFSKSTMSYAIDFARHAGAHLVGVFLEDFTHHSWGVAELTQYEGSSFDRHVEQLNESDDLVRKESIEIFKAACENARLNYSVHRDRNLALQELVHESVYADLLILSARETMTKYEQAPPTRFTRELLEEVQCPVVLVPENYRHIDKAVLLYDGEPSSVYAVRTFGYLFEYLKPRPTQVLTIKAQDESLHLPDNRLVKEFIKRHYPEAEYVTVKGYADDEIVKHLHREKSMPIVVLGAYRRGRVSRFFRQSMADHLLQHVELPLFIAHNKS